MNNYIKPDTVHILGRGKETEYQATFQTDCQEQPNPPQSRWQKFKTKMKHVWKNIVDVAKDIRENIMPIFTGIGSFLVNWATFCNRTQQYNQQRGYYGWIA